MMNANRSSSTKRISRAARIAACVLTALFVIGSFLPDAASAAAPGNQYFERTWERTDYPVQSLAVSRTWMWGPEANTGIMIEPYAQSPGGERVVQYFDKSRMEITYPDRDSGSVWYVTNGLLVVELITGQMQVGDNTFVDRLPAQVNVAGDANDPNGPTYSTFGRLLDMPPVAVGSIYTNRVDRAGNVTTDSSLASFGVTAAHLDEVTNHTIAEPFWSFMNSTGAVYENGEYIDDLLFQNEYFATGRPISEALWATVLIAGTPQDVLMQCFERRCLTYNPANPAGWQVEAGNVGLHYYAWRYGEQDDPASMPPGEEDDAEGEGPGELPPPGGGSEDPTGEGEVPGAPVILQLNASIDAIAEHALVELTFDDGAGEENGFHIFRSQGEIFNYLGSLGMHDRTYIDDEVGFGYEYCYIVTAYNDYGESNASDIACVTTPEAPQNGGGQDQLAAPVLVAPAHGYQTDDRRIEFSWELVDGASTYILCVAEPGASCPNETGNYLKSAPLGPTVDTYPMGIPLWLAADNVDTNLNWTVAACDEYGNCTYQQQYRSFTLALAPEALAAPQLVSPNNGYQSSDRHIEFSWDLVQGASTYIICIAEPGANCVNETGNYYKSAPLGPTVDTYPMDVPYWMVADGETKQLNWTVAACDQHGNCTYQQNVRWFEMTLGLEAPSLLSPHHGYVTTDRDNLFSWDLVDGAATYILCIAEPGASCVNETGNYLKSAPLGPTVDSYPMEVPHWMVADGEVAQINWTVAACDAEGNCTWQQQFRSFTLDLS